MTFPKTPLDARVELLLGSAWTQIQASPTGVRGADGVVITRGRADEQQAGSQQPSTCTMSLNNRDGRYSPRNPLSPYYGQIGRNTPIRVSTPGDGTTFCRVPGRYGKDYASTPDSSSLHITGDIDVRIDVTLANVLQYQTLAVKGDWGGAASGVSRSQSAWIFYITNGGGLRFDWSSSGSGETGPIASTVPLNASQNNTQLGLRATLQVNNGTGGYTVTFYTAPNISGPWTQFGNQIIQNTGTTSIFASNQPLLLGEAGTSARTLNASIMAGHLNAFQLLNGINGTVVASPSFSTLSIGATSFTDAQGNVWTLNGQMEVTNRRYRFYGEISEWPPKWDVSGSDVFTPIEASGILRRYGQGSQVVTSPIRRAITNSSYAPVVYWPCEDAAGVASFAVGAGAGQPMVFSGSPSFASDSHIGGSAPLATLNGSTWTGSVPAYTTVSNPYTHVSMVMYLNSAPANNALVARVFYGGTRVDVGYTTASSGGLWANMYDSTTGALLSSDSSGTAEFAVPLNTVFYLDVTAQNLGGAFVVFPQVDLTTGGGGSGASVAGRSVTSVTQIVINPNGTLTDTVVGHVAIYNGAIGTGPNAFAYPPGWSAMTGNAGETAGSRFVRLCNENGINVRTVGNPADSPAMGSQGTGAFLDLIQTCIDADNGLLYEPRDVLGLGIRMRSSLLSQTPAASISYSGNQLSAVPEPVDDDQLIRNDITITRTNGSFARATLVTGTLSVQDPPSGVGTYSDTPTINFNADSQLLDEVSWRLHVGTVDESRWPLLTTGMHTYEMVANPTLAQQIQLADIGDVLTLTGLPAWLPPDNTNQLVQGTVETMSNFTWDIAFNCSPASPYDVTFLDDAVFARLDSDGSTLHASVGTGDTTWSVDTTGAATGSPLWTTSAGDFPFDVKIDGERVTVTNVTGSSSPQTFTVTRSVNGISKTHTAGAAISLFRPFYLGL